MAYTNEALGKALEDLTNAYNNFIKNAKDQVVQSLGTEVLNEIKEATKSYVSSEEKKEVSKRFTNLFKNGYIQLPGMPSPLEDVNLHFEGYSWHEVNYDGNFFRAKGRNAKAFSSVKLTAEQIKNGTYAFGADEQEDAIRNIKGVVTSQHFGIAKKGWSNTVVSGAFEPFYKEQDVPFADDYGRGVRGLKFDASKADGVKVAEENRSRNLTFTFWALVKDEE